MDNIIGVNDYKNSIIEKSVNLSFGYTPFANDGSRITIKKGADCDYDETMIKKASDDPEKQKKVKKVMDEWKSGKLKSSSGEKVTDQKQAIAIAMSEAGLSKSEEPVTPNKKEPDGSDKYDKMKDTKFGKKGKIKDKIQKAIDENFEKGLIDPLTYLKASVQLDEAIEKAGEGSRGGHVISHTRSGKAVYAKKEADHKDYKDFSAEDHADASSAHMNVRSKHKDKSYLAERSGAYGASETHRNLADHHDTLSNSHTKEYVKKLEEDNSPSLSADEKSALAEQKKRKIKEHSDSHEYHKQAADSLEELHAKMKKKGLNPIVSHQESVKEHRYKAEYHKQEKERLEKGSY